MTAFPFTGNYQTTGDAVTVCVLIIFATIFFKIGIAPFHFWMPDIYEAAPISTTLILSIYPKIVLLDLSIKLAKCFGVCFDQISFFVYLCGFCSILIGSIFALNQGRLKRLLIYSSIAQTGFPICLLAIDKSTESIAIIYLFIILYVLSAILSWGSFIFLYSSLNVENLTSKKIVQFKEPISITDLSGFFSVNKVWMWVFIFLFFGLAGIPPSSTFLSKFFIVKMLLNNKFFFLTIFILFVTVISTFYYIYIITLLFFEVVDEKKKNKTVIFVKKEKDIVFFYNCVSILVCICILFYTIFYLDTWIFYLQKLII
jgi:NADH:ubiquinone oxidoreductase subunit 2 (subunit N)